MGVGRRFSRWEGRFGGFCGFVLSILDFEGYVGLVRGRLSLLWLLDWE